MLIPIQNISIGIPLDLCIPTEMTCIEPLVENKKNHRIKYKFDPLEAVKTFTGRKYGLYCAISGNEPSSVALLNPATKARLLYFNFQKFTREV